MQDSGASLFSSRHTSGFGATLPVDLTYSAFLPTSYTESHAYPLFARDDGHPYPSLSPLFLLRIKVASTIFEGTDALEMV